MRNPPVIADPNYHVPTKKTREQVTAMIGCGLSVTETAHVLGVDEATIQRHYEDEVRHGVAACTAMVGGALLKAAMRGDSNAAKFWLQARARWTVPTRVELTGKNGGPVQVEERRHIMDSILSMATSGAAQDEQQQAMEEKASATVQ